MSTDYSVRVDEMPGVPLELVPVGSSTNWTIGANVPSVASTTMYSYYTSRDGQCRVGDLWHTHAAALAPSKDSRQDGAPQSLARLSTKPRYSSS